MLKTLIMSLLIGVVITWNSAVIAAPIDEITMEVIDVESAKTSDVLNEIKLPPRYEREDGIDRSVARDEMQSSRDYLRESRDEMREGKERLNDSKDRIKGN
jgi:hypothetical protein